MKQSKERLLHHVTVSVFCKPGEDKDALLRGMDVISPVPTAELLALKAEQDPERGRLIHHRGKDIDLTLEDAETDDGKMTIISLFFSRMSWTTAFAKRLAPLIADEPAESLLDYEGKLSVRIDKTLLSSGKLALTDDGHCYQVKASIAAYPRTMENALSVVERMRRHE
jgi:RNA binding exosome subunit